MNFRTSAVLFGSAFSGIALLTLIDAIAKGFALFAVAALVAFALRRASAAARHIVWVSALGCALVLPCCALLLPEWRVLPAWMSWQEVPRRFAASGPAPAVAVPLPSSPTRPIPAPPETFPPPSLPRFDAGEPPIDQATSGIRLNADVLLLAWLAGALVLLAPLLSSTIALWRISARSRVVPDGPITAAVKQLQREIGWDGKVRLLLGSPDTMPMVWGVLRPRLLLPSTATSWTASLLRGVVLHELAHLRRHDPLSILIAQLALAVHWVNPLAWIAVRQLRVEQERACDDYVLRHGVRASDYASDLIAVATDLRAFRFADAALTMAHPGRLEGRVTTILDAARNRRAVTRWIAVAAAVFAAAVALPLAMLRAADEKESEPIILPPAAGVDAEETQPANTVKQEPPAQVSPPETTLKVRGRILDLNGFVLAESTGAKPRSYPFEALAGHVLGYTGRHQDLGRIEGRAGVEQTYDKSLHGGEDVHLSLDARLQSVTEKTLRESDTGRGAVVILDATTSEVRALASTPNVDINSFIPAISLEKWRALSDDLTSPLMNRALQDHAPGSTYHLVVAVAAISAGKANRTYTCSGQVSYGNTAMKCWISTTDSEAGGHGKLNLSDALKHSCSCYFYQLGNEVAIEALEKTARDLGLGQRSGLGLPGESAGIVPSPEWLKKVAPAERWSAGYTANVAIGQGSTSATPVQMATIAAAIANGGRVIAPTLLAGATPQVRHDLTLSGCQPEDLAMLRASMAEFVDSGMARPAKSNVISIAGRTGSSQYWRAQGNVKVAEVAAWFIGYAPADVPRYAFAILVEGGRSGAVTAAPIARRIMEAVAAGLPAPEPQPESDGHFAIVPPSDN